ncbi:patatin-like phospholipase family protein [Metapseudomonas otitidis]|uniref:Patatin n=1 Tax=Metapseudomonas otitidis TaxID=319939 RepID=A0A679GG46_9GAMM|nr:patatin-like phospholipase family protein [Pseudomonas otitidis]BCA26729.1 patatin [Pseudomonas otitidis]
MAIKGKTVGLALSGGGYRATLFSLGSLWRLNEAGLLGQLDRISSVSGGSILAGLLAHRWRKLDFVNGSAKNFQIEVVDPIRKFCSETIDVAAGVKGFFTPFKSAGQYLTECYDKHLFHGAATNQMPDPTKGEGPLFVIYATNLQTGRSFRIRQDMLADWKIGVARGVSIPLAQAVAASSAFPPVFSPIIVQTDSSAWAGGEDIPYLNELRRRIVLADGGVYDNMGLETLIDKVDVVLVSDAGAPFEIEPEPSETPLQMNRVRDILIDQSRALRKRWLISDFEKKNRYGAYWGIDTHIGDYKDKLAVAQDTTVTGSLARLPTRLADFGRESEERLINWGYALADAALRTRAEFAIEKSLGLPMPDSKLTE